MKRAVVFIWRGTKLIDVKPDLKAARDAHPAEYEEVFNGLRAGDLLLQPIQQAWVQ